MKTCCQEITFYGVETHHQHGVEERRIQDLTQGARTALAYASHRNTAVTAHIWPYALKHASNIRRLIPREFKVESPEELMSGSPARPTMKNLHPFGCPVYLLDSNLQSGNSTPKWQER